MSNTYYLIEYQFVFHDNTDGYLSKPNHYYNGLVAADVDFFPELCVKEKLNEMASKIPNDFRHDPKYDIIPMLRAWQPISEELFGKLRLNTETVLLSFRSLGDTNSEYAQTHSDVEIGSGEGQACVAQQRRA